MKYNFDKSISRKNTGSIKWDNMEEMYGKTDLLPMWVADMDFESPKEIIDAFVERSKHGVFGYTWREDDFYEAVINWVKRRYDWEIKKEWILFTPGVVMGLNLGVINLTNPGDKVIIQPPVYPPFANVVTNKDRILLENNLVDTGEKFEMDLDGLKESIDDKTKLAMICSPHNPVGRVWREEELLDLGQILLDKNIPIISDEIHADFVFEGHKHRPIAALSKELEQNTITLIAPSKTFNIAGLGTSVAIIPNEELRKKYEEGIEYMGIAGSNIYGNLGLTVAYNEGEDWLEQLLPYLEANVDYTMDYIEKNIPEIKVYRPDGTYLMWLNFDATNKTADQVKDALINVGKIALNDGRTYSEELGDNYFRLNIGCPRQVLEEGLGRIKKAVDSLK